MREHTSSRLFHFLCVRTALTQHSTEVLVNALVTSRLDCCNAILAGLPNKLIHRLHIIQNSAAQIITRWKSTDPVTSLLIELHWLPVLQRINFKIELMTFKALHNLSPVYIIDLLQIDTPSCSLWSSSAGLRALPVLSLTTTGAMAFSYAAPKLWTSLPAQLHYQIQRLLKLVFFT